MSVSVYTCGMCKLRVPAPLKYYLDNLSEIVLKGETVRENLTSESGKILRKKRLVEVDTVFGNIKYKLRFRRFRLREFGEGQYRGGAGVLCP